MLKYSLEYLFSYTATVTAAPEAIGPVPEGIRLNFYISGGTVEGPKLNGKILPVGGDWLTVRSDGVGLLDVRGTLETDDGALVYAAYTGIVDLGEDGYQRVMRQDLPATAVLRTAPRFATAHPKYQWLNRLQCVGIGESNLPEARVSYDIYALR